MLMSVAIFLVLLSSFVASQPAVYAPPSSVEFGRSAVLAKDARPTAKLRPPATQPGIQRPLYAPPHLQRVPSQDRALVLGLPVMFVLPATFLLGVLAALSVRWRKPALAMAAFTGKPSYGGDAHHWPAAHSKSTALRASENSDPTLSSEGNELANRPKPVLQAKTPTGEFLLFILANYPHLFEESIQAQLKLLCEAKDQQEQEMSQISESNLVLYQRIGDVKGMEQRRALEDLLYFSVLREFGKLGVSNIEPQQMQKTADFVHINIGRVVSAMSKEEKEVVLAHMKKMLGPMGGAEIFSGPFMPKATLKILKFHAFEMFASSLLFGYFLRHTYKRFALARSLGMAPKVVTHQDNVAMLDDLYSKADIDAADLDRAKPIENAMERGRAMTLKEYVEGLDRKELAEASQFVSQEAAQVVQDYINTLFGDVNLLLKQIQEVVNEPTPVTSPEEYTQRMTEAAAMDKVEMLEIEFGDVKRLILEAVAFGTFLKDAESFVEITADRPILTPAPRRVP